MRNRNKQIALVAALVTALCAAVVLLVNCGVSEPMRCKKNPPVAGENESTVSNSIVTIDWIRMKQQAAEYGTKPPNDAAYNAVFFKHYGVNPIIDTNDDNLSTFAVDVDTGSYTICRRYLNDGFIPPDEAVRVEEFLNFFDYRYAPPEDDAFAIYLDGAPSKFGKNHHILKIGIKGREIETADRKEANLTFVIDTSGSMGMGNRLGLVKKALRLLVDQLREDDRIGIVEYGSRARMVLMPTTAADKKKIIRAIESLQSNGSTNAEEGIEEGYKMADRVFEQGAINRVILCSDGVANVGRTGPESIFKVIEDKTKRGIRLSTIGFGRGNFNDVLMERLADKGDGNYAYVDTLSEARRIFVENLTGTLQVIAKDVKVQVDFNPETVSRYRLLGYENRKVDDDKFRDDDEDGGEIGAGHSVTALYEIKFHKKAASNRVATVFIRYKDPETGEVSEVKRDITMNDFAESFEKTPAGFRLAAATAEFAEILRKSYWANGSRFADVLPLIKNVLEQRPRDERIAELLKLVAQAEELCPDEVAVKKDFVPSRKSE